MEPLLARLAHEGVAAEKQDDEFFQRHRVAADNPGARRSVRIFAATWATSAVPRGRPAPKSC